MMKEPNEKWLDRHFSQQLEEYEPIFQQEASESDQEIISYWLQIFQAAPKAQKWARNSLMLLMYGHLKEMGYLQVPFTDMSNLGRNLNEILDGYTGLPVTNRTRSPKPLTPITEEQTLSPSETDESTTMREELCSSRSSPMKRLISCRTSHEEATLAHESTENSASRSASGSARSSSHLTLYETFDSHMCYKQKDESDLCVVESKRMLEVDAVINSMHSLNSSPLAAIAEEEANTASVSQHSYTKLFKQIFRANEDNFQQMQYADSTTSRALTTSPASSGSSDVQEEPEATVGKETVRIEPNTRRSMRLASPWGSPELSPRRADDDAELMYLRRRHKQLRRECRIYYHKNGKLRKYPKYPRTPGQPLGFLTGAYKAHSHFRRQQAQNKQPRYFHQEYNRTKGWRTYRRILMVNAVPRSVLCPARYTQRHRSLLRMAQIMQLLNMYTEMSASGRPIGHGHGHEIQCLWTRNLALENHMQCNQTKSVQ